MSAFAFGGIPEKAVKKVFAEANTFVSPDILREYRQVPLALESQGKIDHLQFKSLISGIAAFVATATLVHPVHTLRVCRDPEDNRMIECCLAAKADFLITGDKDLLEIENVPFHLKILSPRSFLKS